MPPLPPPPDRGTDALRAAAAILAFFAIGILLAAAASVPLVRAAAASDSAWGAALLRRGPGKVAVRLMQAAALVLFPALLRALRWRGWRDTGLVPPPGGGAGRALRGMAAGAGLGLLSVGLCAAALLAAGRRFADPDPDWAGSLLRLLAAGLVVGFAEELAARGILFRTLSRPWTPAGAALLTSVFFSAVHFIEPPAAAYDLPGFWAPWRAASGAALFPFSRMDAAQALRFANLALMGGALCALFARSGHLWPAVGLHAGWVWALKANDRLTNPRAVPPSLFWGARSDLTDSLLAALLLAALLLAILWAPRRAAAPPRGAGRRFFSLPP